MASRRYTEFGLFLDADHDDDMAGLLERHWHIRASHGFLRPEGYLVSVSRNKTRDENADPDSFFSWGMLIDVRADESITDEQAVRFLSDLVRLLEEAGYRSVVDRDFPDDLSGPREN